MAIDKSVSQAPQGIEELAAGQPALSIEIENPDSVTLDDGSMEITIEPGKETNDEFNANLAEDLDEGQLTELAGEDRKSTRLNSSHVSESRMPSSA